MSVQPLKKPYQLYVTSYLILYMCPQPHGVLHIFLYRVLSQHRPPRLCLAHARRYRERHRCVRACVIVRACVCLRACVCVHMYSLSVCLSQAAFSAFSIFFSEVRSIYLSSSCCISSSYLSSQLVLKPLHMRRENDAAKHMLHCDDLMYLAS